MSENILEKTRILPVVVIEDSEDAVPLGEALIEGGIHAIEVTFRTTAAAASIRAIRERLPEMTVSSGTVITADQAKQAIDSGAQFGLAPGLDTEIVSIFSQAGLPFVPGVMTPTDVQAALKADCRHLKFFPAEAAGGLSLLKSLIAPFKSTGVRFCPTGGIKPANMEEYLALPQVFAIGGTWLATPRQIQEKDWQTITEQARTALERCP